MTLLQLLSPLSPQQAIIHRLNEMGNRQGDQEERLDAFMRQIAEMQKTLRKLQNESGEHKTHLNRALRILNQLTPSDKRAEN